MNPIPGKRVHRAPAIATAPSQPAPESLSSTLASPALTGAVFTSTWNDVSVADLFERIRISMPLDRPSTLSRAQTADVAAFLLTENKWPAGSAERPRAREALKEITIQALKP